MPVICPDFDVMTSALGILVCERRGELPPFAESVFLRRLMKTGSLIGLTVFAFAPWTWSSLDGMVTGWTWNDRNVSWQRHRRPLPRLVYDRAWPADQQERARFRLALQRINTCKRPSLLNAQLPHKGEVLAVLAKDGLLSDLLPPTATYTGPAALDAWVARHGGCAFLKPASGSQGKRVVAYVRRKDGSVNLTGRQDDNRPFDVTFDSRAKAADRLNRWIGSRIYLMQPLLELRMPGGEPFDVRALVQKNGKGRWTLTGVAARCGRPGSVTANLHGGGTATSAEQVLAPMFGSIRAKELLQDIHDYCRHIVRRLEENYGRLAELGLDFGVDRSGRLWFMEANSKPGRTAMTGISCSVAHAAMTRPIDYARSILLRPHGRVTHEFDHL